MARHFNWFNKTYFTNQQNSGKKVNSVAFALGFSELKLRLLYIVRLIHGIIPPEQWDKESDETSRIFCGHVNFSEMIGGKSVNRGTKSNNHKGWD